MSGIIRSAKSKYWELDMRDHLPKANEGSEFPTLADLVLPGTGHNFSDEFACLLRLLGEERKPA
jgi:hypothetical protein